MAKELKLMKGNEAIADPPSVTVDGYFGYPITLNPRFWNI